MLVRKKKKKDNVLNGGSFNNYAFYHYTYSTITPGTLNCLVLTMLFFEQKALGPILRWQKRHSSLWMPKLLEKGR